MTKENPSLLRKQLKLLALEEAAGVDASDEQRRQQELSLPPLILPEEKLTTSNVRIVWGGVIGFAVAATIAFVVLPHPKQGNDIYTMKGRSLLQVFFKRDEVVERLMPGQTLQSGEQIRVSITASDSGKAYLSYLDQNNKLLTSYDELIKSGVPVRSGEKVEFPGSARLTGVNQGEKVLVLVCDKTAEGLLEGKGQEAVAADLGISLNAGESQMRAIGCQILSQKLR